MPRPAMPPVDRGSSRTAAPGDPPRRTDGRGPGTFGRSPAMVSIRPPAPVVALVAALLLAACAREGADDGLPEGVAVEDLPEGESWNADLRVSEGGVPVLQIAAPYLARFAREDSSFIRLGPAAGDSARVRLSLFDDEGAPRAVLSAAEMRYDETTGRVQASGDVEAELTGRARVRAPRIDTSADGAFEASGGARVELLGETKGTVTAPRVASSAGGGFVASGGARVVLSGAQSGTITARRVESSAGGAFAAEGDARVVLADPRATITARRITGSGSGRRYDASGGARVDPGGGRRLASDRVTWDAGSERFRAPGAFSFESPGERIRGTDLVATADLSRYTFRRASGQIEVEE